MDDRVGLVNKHERGIEALSRPLSWLWKGCAIRQRQKALRDLLTFFLGAGAAFAGAALAAGFAFAAGFFAGAFLAAALALAGAVVPVTA